MSRRNLYILSVIFAQFLWLGGMCFFYWLPYRDDGIEIVVSTVPVDPRDFFRGDYVELSYEFSRPRQSLTNMNDGKSRRRQGTPVYVVLEKERNSHLWRMDKQTFDFPGKNEPDSSRVMIRGIFNRWAIKYGVEQFFMQEGTAKIVEAVARGSENGKKRVEVTLRVTPWGRATVKNARVVEAPEAERGALLETNPVEISNPQT